MNKEDSEWHFVSAGYYQSPPELTITRDLPQDLIELDILLITIGKIYHACY